jgi:hypothetical protein
MKTTKLPWKVFHNLPQVPKNEACAVFDASGTVRVATIGGYHNDQLGNAALIVQAVNEHAALVAVAEAAKLVLETPEPMTRTEHFDYSANSQRLLKSALANLAAVQSK